MDKVVEYCMRGIIQYLEGDTILFNKYKQKAMDIYSEIIEDELGMYRLENRITEREKQQIYGMVS